MQFSIYLANTDGEHKDIAFCRFLVFKHILHVSNVDIKLLEITVSDTVKK